MKISLLPPQVLAPVLGFSRFALYTIESFPIIFMRKILRVYREPSPKPPSDFRKISLEHVQKMINEDVENLRQNIYPQSLILPESPIEHLKRYHYLLIDALNSTLRVREQEHQEFSKEVVQNVEELPKYYQRNFHFQTDGYLSPTSAELYGHQTEILFAGTLDLMRRILLAPLIQKIKAIQGPVRVLEFGCGAGESSRILLESCPNIELTAVELSQAYLQKAQEKLKNFKNVEFKLEAAEEFTSAQPYDVVLSAFLLHELPKAERIKILKIAMNQLKPGGIFWHIDSLQIKDEPNFDWALIQFPKDFHEPFFKNYVNTPLDQIFAELGLANIETKKAFLAKAVFATTSEAQPRAVKSHPK